MTQIESLRQQIARNYCRSILWADDEIRMVGDYPNPDFNIRYRHFFLPTATALQAEGVLCQLQTVTEPDDPDDDPEELVVVKRLSKVADAIILDWHLAGSTPRYSIEIIRHLLDEQETRFILILTQHSGAMAEFKLEFGKDLQDKEGILALGNGKHVAILHKPDSQTDKNDCSVDFSADILSALDKLIATAYPDYVHWAGLEIAGGIKRFVPRWLESLPRDMDWALLSEYCYGKESTAEMLVENLLEDLSHCITPHHLASTLPQNCRGSDYAWLIERLSQEHGIDDPESLQLLSLAEPPPNIKNGLPSMFAKANHALIREFIESQKKFNSFCENISLGSAGEGAILPGSVFKQSNAIGEREIYVCVSQGCDCLRGDELLFVRGKKESSPKNGSTLVNFKGRSYRFDAEGKNLKVLTINNLGGQRLPQNHVKIGQLRAATARRLAARFWNYSTRSAVNHSAYARAERRGE